MYLESSLLISIPGIQHGFGTQSEPIPNPFQLNSRPKWKQVHGSNVVEVTHSNQDCGEADGFYSASPKIPVGIITADCVPILLARRDGKRIAAIHAGWRGTESRILRELWKKLTANGENPKDWVAAIGPCIRPCCYEVSEELALKFELGFSHLGNKIAVPSYRRLDLQAINKGELLDIGIPKVDVLQICTKCSQSPTFNSHRNGDKGRQYSLISIN